MRTARIIIAAVLAAICGCAVHREADGTTTADFGRDAGLIYSKDSTGAVYVVMDQNESKSLGRIVSGLVAKWGFELQGTVAQEETARETAATAAATQQQQISANQELDLLKESNRSTEALTELELSPAP